jgi:hypothetical protein
MTYGTPKAWWSLKAWADFFMGPNDSSRVNAIVYVLQTNRFQEDDIVAEKIISALDGLGTECAFQSSQEHFDAA